MAPQPVSRINSFSRNWSQEEPDMDVEWEPSLPPKPKPKPTVNVLQPSSILQKPSTSTLVVPRKPGVRQASKPLTKEASEARARLIKEALEGGGPPSSRPSQSTAGRTVSASSSSSTKRGLDDEEDIGEGTRPAKKRATEEGVKTTATTGAAGLNIKQKVVLSTEQQQILGLVVDGQNVFFTGSAGTGKSVLLREIITTMRKKYSKTDDAVAVTASTGIAACNVGGVTLHSFAGCGLAAEPVGELSKKIARNRKAMSRWQRTKVLIIDEVSMVDGDFFDKLAQLACALRKKTEPFGGIQLVVTGDFFQLPPVTKGPSSATKFAFDAEAWSTCVQRTFNLTKVFRQKDQDFVDMLTEMRFGRISEKTENKFKHLSRKIMYNDKIEPTELFPRREDVDRANVTRMNALPGEAITFDSYDAGLVVDPKQRETMLGNFMAPGKLLLKVNAQVMLIKNTDETLVNGSLGLVEQFMDIHEYTDWVKKNRGIATTNVKDDDGDAKLSKKSARVSPKFPLVKFNVPGGAHRYLWVQPETFKVELHGEIQVSRSQIPLILAWAMSIHKSQGQTLDRLKVDLGRVFEKGQAYVAISRATSLGGLQILGFQKSKVQVHPKVAEWSKTLEKISLPA